MAEIAQQLRVAPSTISRALRGDERISPALRQRVREVAERLGYRPNPLVSALMATRRRRNGAGEVDVIALVTNYDGRVSWRTKEVCRWEFEGIQARAGALGFKLEVMPLREYGGDPQRLVATLRARGIRGVLLGFSREETAQPPFPTSGFCVVGLSAYFPTSHVDRANFHGFYNVQLALSHMHRLGYTRPALVVPEENNRISNNLWTGAFLDWQRRLPPRDRCAPFLPTGDEGVEEFATWFLHERPDALLVYKVPVVNFLAQRGLAKPGLAYLYRTAQEMGGSAGIDGNLPAVGAAALDLVVEKLNANMTETSEYPKEVLIQGTWRDGVTLPPRPPRAETRSAPRRKSAKARAEL